MFEYCFHLQNEWVVSCAWSKNFYKRDLACNKSEKCDFSFENEKAVASNIWMLNYPRLGWIIESHFYIFKYGCCKYFMSKIFTIFISRFTKIFYNITLFTFRLNSIFYWHFLWLDIAFNVFIFDMHIWYMIYIWGVYKEVYLDIEVYINIHPDIFRYISASILSCKESKKRKNINIENTPNA